MTRASRRRSTAVAAFALLALVAELVGRSVTLRVDRALSVVEPLATPTTRYYPFLLAGVKMACALAAAALVWRLLRAHAMAVSGGAPPRDDRPSPHRLAPPASLAPLGAALARLVRRDLALVPRPERLRARRPGALAVARAVAAHLRAAGLRRPRDPARARLGRGARLARRRRELRRRRPSRAPAASFAPRCRLLCGRGRLGTAPRATSSGSRSSRARRRSPADPRLNPCRGSSRPDPRRPAAGRVIRLAEEQWSHTSPPTCRLFGRTGRFAHASSPARPADVARRVVWAIAPAVPPHAAAPARPGLLVARDRAAAARRRGRGVLRPRDRPAARRRPRGRRWSRLARWCTGCSGWSCCCSA